MREVLPSDLVVLPQDWARTPSDVQAVAVLLWTQVKEQPVRNADEKGWQEGNRLVTLYDRGSQNHAAQSRR